MNLLFVHEINWIEKVILDCHWLAELLSTLGHNVFVIDHDEFWRKKNHPLNSWLKTVTTRNVQRLNKHASLTVIRPGFVPIPVLSRTTAWLTYDRLINQVLREQAIDAVLLYAVPTYGLQTIRATRKRGVPVLFRHIDVLHRLVPYAALRPPTLLMEKLVASKADKTLALSPRLRDYLIGLGTPAEKAYYLPLGIDMSHFYPREKNTSLMQQWSIDETDKIVLFVSTMNKPFIGLSSFLENFPIVLQAVPEAKLLVVGGGRHLPSCKSKAQQLGISERVVFTDRQPYDLVPEFISIADVCINTFQVEPATHYTLPAKDLEYLACAKPVVDRRQSGTEGVVGNNKGVLFAKDDSEFANMVTELLMNYKYSHTLGQRGYEYVKVNHDWKKIANDLENIIKESIQNP